MRFTPTSIADTWLIELERHEDERGSFARAFCEREFGEYGLPTRFPQCNLSTNTRRGTLRGMHFNTIPEAEAKLVRCVRGAIYDVVVDLRRDSPTKYQWLGFELDADNGQALFVPAGLAHGFLTMQDHSDVYYHMSELFRPSAARGFRWDDAHFSITWPGEPQVISSRDLSWPAFATGAALVE